MTEGAQDSPITINADDFTSESLDIHRLRGASGDLEILDAGAVDVNVTGLYVVHLMNADPEWTCFAISFDNQNWSATPLVGRTCFEACTDAGTDKCFAERKFSPIATINCGTRNMSMWLKFKNAKGQVGTITNPYVFTPSCDKKGGVFPFCG